MEYPLGQTCCGLPAKMMAEKAVAREVALQNLAALDPAEYDYILTLCASCGSHIKEAYPKLLAGEPAAVKAEQMADKLMDFSSFLTRVLKVTPERFQGGKKKVAYHAALPPLPGHGGGAGAPGSAGYRWPGVPSRPGRGRLLRHGRHFFRRFPGAVGRVAQEETGRGGGTGADLLVTDCPGCVLQLKGGWTKRRQARGQAHRRSRGRGPERVT